MEAKRDRVSCDCCDLCETRPDIDDPSAEEIARQYVAEHGRADNEED